MGRRLFVFVPRESERSANERVDDEIKKRLRIKKGWRNQEDQAKKKLCVSQSHLISRSVFICPLFKLIHSFFLDLLFYFCKILLTLQSLLFCQRLGHPFYFALPFYFFLLFHFVLPLFCPSFLFRASYLFAVPLLFRHPFILYCLPFFRHPFILSCLPFFRHPFYFAALFYLILIIVFLFLFPHPSYIAVFFISSFCMSVRMHSKESGAARRSHWPACQAENQSGKHSGRRASRLVGRPFVRVCSRREDSER